MSRGLFISLEGPDGSGKSTQVAFLQRFFNEQRIDAVFTREPGGTRIGEKIRDIILDKEYSEMDGVTEALLYAASRAQHVEEVIKPALEAGKVVVCDRFVDSSIAYQGYGRQLGDQVRIINEYAVAGCMPDITILMELDPGIGKGRIKAESQDRLEREKLEFHNRVYRGYRQLAEADPERFVEIDASRTKTEIRDDIIERVRIKLAERELIAGVGERGKACH